MLAPQFDTGTPEHPHDATRAFQLQAKDYVKRRGIPSGSYFMFNNHTPELDRRVWFCRTVLGDKAGIRTLAFFMHGTFRWIQLGFHLEHVPMLANALSRACDVRDLRICLYACSAASEQGETEDHQKNAPAGGEGGFADALRDELLRLKVQTTVYAHATVGHTTENPFVRVFGPYDPDKGGLALIEHHDPLFPAWERALRQGDLWQRYPLMTREELRLELGGR